MICIYCQEPNRYGVHPVNEFGKHVDLFATAGYNGMPHGVKCQDSDGKHLTYWAGYSEKGYEIVVDAEGHLSTRAIK